MFSLFLIALDDFAINNSKALCIYKGMKKPWKNFKMDKEFSQLSNEKAKEQFYNKGIIAAFKIGQKAMSQKRQRCHSMTIGCHLSLFLHTLFFLVMDVKRTFSAKRHQKMKMFTK